MKCYKAIILLFSLTLGLRAELNIVTTTTVIYDLVRQIGGDRVTVDYICRGDQDPHFLEVLPSYMLKIRKADLMFQNGLGLELWAQKLIDGSRNADLKLIDLSQNITKKGVPTGKIDASQGDIHPFGNPHYWLDPMNAKIMAEEILNQLAVHDPENKKMFQTNFERFIADLDQRFIKWQNRFAEKNGMQIIAYHDSWIYFADRFGLRVTGFVEPKPGIPPTPSHNAELIRLISGSEIKLILMENFYSDGSPNQIAAATGIPVVKVPVYVYGVDGVDSYLDLIDYIINHIAEND